jgi:hypothetical protein
MNKPERLPHPDFSYWLPASLRDHADDQKAIPRIAKDAGLMREIEAARFRRFRPRMTCGKATRGNWILSRTTACIWC